MKFLLLSPPLFDNQERNLLIEFFKQGLCTYHLRKPSYSSQEIENFLLKIPSQYYPKIMLHSHHHLVEKYHLKGCHFTENERKKMTTNIDKKGVYSTGFHTIQEALSTPYSWNYVFLSPIYDSISKENYQSNFTEEKLKTEGKRLFQEKEVIALGGIQKEHFLTLKEIGFAGCAMIGTIWNSENPLNAFEEIQKWNDF